MTGLAARPVRWGFLGAGNVATFALAPAVHAACGAVLQAVAAREPDRARALRPTGRVYGDYAALLEDDDVDAVYISLPNAAHRRWALAALDAGKHVLCEKPLACSAAEVHELAAAARSTDRLLVEATWYRWHPRTRRALSLLDDLGPALEVEAAFCFGDVPAGDFRLDPAQGGGALADVGCYALSAAAAFLRAEQLDVVSAQLQTGPTGVDVAGSAQVVGGTGNATVRFGIDETEVQGVVVRCERGTLELVAPPFTAWHEPARLRVVVDGVEREERFDGVDAYQLMVQACSDRVTGGTSFVQTLDESLIVATAADAIRTVASAVS